MAPHDAFGATELLARVGGPWSSLEVTASTERPSFWRIIAITHLREHGTRY